MNTEYKGILDKLAKLLALEENSMYDGERQAARALITKLLAQYQVTLDDVTKSEKMVMERLYRKAGKDGGYTIDHTDAHLLGNLCEFSGATYVAVRGDKPSKRLGFYWVIGKVIDVNATIYLYEVINTQSRQLLEGFRTTVEKEGRKWGRALHASYMLGLNRGIAARLQDIVADVLAYQQEAGLVLVNPAITRTKAAEAWVADQMKVEAAIHTRKVSEQSAYSTGKEDAKKVKIFQPVAERSKETKALGD